MARAAKPGSPENGMTLTVAVIDPTGGLQLHQVAAGRVEQLVAAVAGGRSGEIAVHARLSVWHAGRPHDLRSNPLATAMVATFEDSRPLSGVVVVTGGRGVHGRPRSLTSDQLAALQTVSRFWLDHQEVRP